MKKNVYISSTSKDLAEYRKAATTALEKIQYVTTRMENSVARPERTRVVCEADVAACDTYLGIFAWRYGESPKDEELSFTELEYRRAANNKPCFIFLLRDDAEWPDDFRDSVNGEGNQGERILKLRTELKENHSPAYFSSPHELGMEVIAAIHQHESTLRVTRLDLVDEMQERLKFGGSFLPNIQAQMAMIGDVEIVEISLGPIKWWTTRLHLLAALASDFTKIRQFVFLDGDGNYALMASPLEIRRAFTRRLPQLERAYLASRPPAGSGIPEINHIVRNYSSEVYKAFDNRYEQDVKEDVSAEMLKKEFGIESSAAIVRQQGSLQSQFWEILGRETPFVVLLAKDKLFSVIDRVRMTSQIAIQAYEELG